MSSRKIELLSPARDLECGLAAIDHGADAVYIGASQYSARADAGNSLHDIEQLSNYAHLFGAKVYLAINTILYDDEIECAVKLAWDSYHAGVDALIIQDMGLLECDLPPIPLHASTQTNNTTAEKVVFLEKIGFSQIVLARELNLEQIKEIGKNCSVILEFFIHGALCTSYSGQCYMSQYATGRSGNRGECAQMCRHIYSLFDSDNKSIISGKYLLSLKDLNLTNHIEDLIDAGISSFKIEGRLKGPEYVKNITAHYRKIIDAIIENRSDLIASSTGKCYINFTPGPEKTFNRLYSNYFITNENQKIANINSPKSIGAKLGKIYESGDGWFIIDTHESIENGDGLCYYDEFGNLTGFRANKVEGNKVNIQTRLKIPTKTLIFRNKDTQFEDDLRKSNACRKIEIDLKIFETDNGICLRIIDEQGIVTEVERKIEKQDANNPEKQTDLIKQQLTKTGDTIFQPHEVEKSFSKPLFIASKVINELRREAISAHKQNRLDLYERKERNIVPNSFPYLKNIISYQENISNKKAENFYRRHGAIEIENAFELQQKKNGQLLMLTKYCVRKELNICHLEKENNLVNYSDPLYIEDNTGKYRLEFDCRNCNMKIYST